MSEFDDDDIDELADLWGVEPEDVEAYLLEREQHAEDLEAAREAAEALEEAREEALDDEYGELAELWGATPDEVADLFEEIGEAPDALTQDELREYIDDLYEQLTDEGWDLDVSDLWDMYYGYTPGGEA